MLFFQSNSKTKLVLKIVYNFFMDDTDNIGNRTLNIFLLESHATQAKRKTHD